MRRRCHPSFYAMSQPQPVEPFKATHRVIWIDVCRIIAFFYIALSHCWLDFTPYAGATRSSVALFFVISAFFCANKPLKDIVKRSCILMVCIYFWHSLSSMVIHQNFSLCTPSVHLLLDLGSLWFLRELAICMLISLLIRRLSLAGQLALIAILISCLSDEIEYTPPQSTIFSLVFFNVGIVLKKLSPNHLSAFLFPHIGKIRGRGFNLILTVITLLAVPFVAFLTTSSCPVAAYCFVIMALISHSAVFLEQCNMGERFRMYVFLFAQAGFFFYASHCIILRLFVSLYIKLTGGFPGAFPCVVAIAAYFTVCALIVKYLAGRNRYSDIILLAR